MKTESTINGKSEGMTEREHKKSPLRMPSPRSALLNKNIAPMETARNAVKKLCLFKKTPAFKQKWSVKVT